MKLDIIAQIVQILKDAPEVGAIEIRRGLFGAWSSVRVSKAGHAGTNAGDHLIVSQAAAPGSVAGGAPKPRVRLPQPPRRRSPICSRSNPPWSAPSISRPSLAPSHT